MITIDLLLESWLSSMYESSLLIHSIHLLIASKDNLLTFVTHYPGIFNNHSELTRSVSNHDKLH